MCRRFPRWFASRLGATCSTTILLLALIVAGTVVDAQNQDKKTEAALIRSDIPLPAEARADVIRWALAHPGVAERARGHRLSGIRVRAGSTTNASGETKTIVTVVLFDHTALEARRVVIDATSGVLLTNELLPGRPQSSREEFEEAIEIVRRDADLSRLLDAGAIVDGGFIVDDPAGSRRRMIQLKLLTTDRLTLLQSVTVDLTRREIAATGDR